MRLTSRTGGSFDLPLNLEGNSPNQFHQILTRTRVRCAAEGKHLGGDVLMAGSIGVIGVTRQLGGA